MTNPADEPDESEDKLMLVTSKHCPNCDHAKSFMDEADIQYDVLDAESHPEIVSKYSIRSAPTLVVVHGQSFKTIANISNIRAFVDSQCIVSVSTSLQA
jgi:ribonucleoside-triphosphate reductase